MNAIRPHQNPSKRIHLRRIALGMSSGTLLIAAGLLIAGIRSEAAPYTVKPVHTSTVKVDPTPAPAVANVYDELHLSNAGLDLQVFEMAMKGYDKLRSTGKTGTDSVLAIIDFSKPSSEKRLFIIDLKKRKLAFQTYVAHGKNSGLKFARQFSNTPESHMSSLGFYVTLKTYQGSNGYSLQLDGCEKGVNDNALDRAIVMHAADYASESLAKNRGYIGRSYGCPAVPKALHKPIIDRLKDGNVLFIYYPDQEYLQKSEYING